jgi:hypothetical protein
MASRMASMICLERWGSNIQESDSFKWKNYALRRAHKLAAKLTDIIYARRAA